MAISTGSLYRVRATLSGFQGGPGLYTAYFRVDGSSNAADAAVCAERVRGAWDVVKTVVMPTCTIQVQSVVDVIGVEDGALNKRIGIAPPASVTGTGASASAPVEVAAGLVLSTGDVFDRRVLAGRSFISPLAVAAQNGVNPPVGTKTAVNAFGVALIGAAPPLASVPAVVWRRPAPGRNGVASEILSATVAPKWFVLRSRRD